MPLLCAILSVILAIQFPFANLSLYRIQSNTALCAYCLFVCDKKTLSCLLIKFYCGCFFDYLEAIRSNCFLFNSIPTPGALHATTKRSHKCRGFSQRCLFWKNKNSLKRKLHSWILRWEFIDSRVYPLWKMQLERGPSTWQRKWVSRHFHIKANQECV